MSVEEERKISLNGCKLDKSTLKKICELLEIESQKIKEENKNASVYLTFKIESKKKDITASTTESLLNSIPKKFNDILLSLYVVSDKKQEVWIRLALSSLYDSNVTVKGIDSTWVNGIAIKIEDILTENKTKNWIFNNYFYRSPFVIAIAILIGTSVAFLDITYLHEEWNDEQFYEHIYDFSFIAGFPTYWVFGWLFPKIEYEEMLIQTRIRKKFFAGLGMILIGLIVAVVSKLLPN